MDQGERGVGQVKKPDLRAIEEDDLRARTERFLDELKARGTYKKIYENGHTYVVVQAFQISYESFYKQLERMKDGKGLYGNPILLSAVLHDTSYPASILFGDETDHRSIEANFVLGPGTAQEIQRIVANAILNTEKPMRQLGIKRRINAAFTVLFIAKIFQANKNYGDAINTIFLSYSISSLSLYPHGRVKSMASIDKLAKYHLNALNEEQRKLVGSVLVLAFLIFEIARMSYSLLAITNKCRNRAKELQPDIIGFIYDGGEASGEIRKKVDHIDSLFANIVGKITEGDRLPSFQIPENNLIASISLLENLLSFKFTTPNDDFNDEEMKDFIFKSVINLNEKYSYHMFIMADNDLYQKYDELILRLTAFDKALKSKINLEGACLLSCINGIFQIA